MEYFVSAEDTTYHHWQLELLIESFKLHGMLDNLVIGIASNDEEKLVDYTYNLKTCKRMFLHDNIGRKRGYLPLNRPYSLYAAVNQGLVKQPFALIDPDMILVVPIPQQVENITFQLKPLFTSDFCEQNHCQVRKHIKELLKLRKIEDDNTIDYWIPLGSLMTFNNVPLDFFSRVVEWTEILEFERKRKSSENWWWTEKVAWVMTLLEYHGHLTYKGGYDYEMTLLDSNQAKNFVHYEHGLPPVFSKHMYRYQPPQGFTMGNLFDVLLSNNPTSTTNYVQHVVRSYLKTRPREKQNETVTKEYKVQMVTVRNEQK
jgi:hypothetical protein